MCVGRVRPRALRGMDTSMSSARAVSPVSSFGEVPWSLGASGRCEIEESLLGGVESRVPYVLVPSVKVTPEVEVVGHGESSMWVAVEVGAQLGRPDGAGAVGEMGSRHGGGPMGPDLSKYRTMDTFHIPDPGGGEANGDNQVLSLTGASTTSPWRYSQCLGYASSTSYKTTHSLCKSGSHLSLSLPFSGCSLAWF